MIILKSIKLENFLSHQKTEIKIGVNQKLLIDGKSGSGKSSIVEGILWGLYGKGRVNNRAIIKHGKKKATVTVELIDDNVFYRIIRTVTTSGKQTLDLLQSTDDKKYEPVKTNGLKETQSLLEKEILHSSYTLFINSVVYPQDNVENFVKQTAAKRKDLILEMVNADSFEEYFKKTKEELKTREIELAKNEENIERSKELINEENEKGFNISECEKKTEETQKKIDDIDAQLILNQQKREENLKSKFEADNIQRIIKDMEQGILRLDMEFNELETEYKEKSSIDVADIKNKLNEFNNKRAELVDFEKQRDIFMDWQIKYNDAISKQPVDYGNDKKIAELNKLIIDIQKEELELCPELNKICPILKKKQDERIERKNEQLVQLMAEQEKFEKDMGGWNKLMSPLREQPYLPINEIKRLKEELTVLSGYEEKYNAIKEIDRVLGDINKKLDSNRLELTKSKQLLEKKKKEAKDLLASLKTDELNSERNKLLVEYSRLKVVHDQNIVDLSEAKQSKQTRERAIKTMKENIANLKVNGEIIDGLKILKEAFGPNGLKTIVIEYVLPRLEDKINDILGKLSDFRVCLETQKNTATTENVIDGLFITIKNDMGEELDFDNYSGGERLKIIVAISEALSEIQRVGFRILDELFIGLDEESTEKFAKVMAELQQRFDQLLCISHLRNIKDMFDESVELVKVDGTSKII